MAQTRARTAKTALPDVPDGFVGGWQVMTPHADAEKRNSIRYAAPANEAKVALTGAYVMKDAPALTGLAATDDWPGEVYILVCRKA